RGARELWTALVAEQSGEVRHAHNLARTNFNLAYVTSMEGPTPESLAAYPRAQAIWERLLREFGENVAQRCDVARCYHNHTNRLAEAGRYEESLAACERSLPHFDRLVELVPGDANLAALRQQAHQHHEQLLESDPRQALDEFLAEVNRRAAPV